MDLADASGTEHCDTYHGFLRRKCETAPLPRTCGTVHSSGIEWLGKIGSSGMDAHSLDRLGMAGKIAVVTGGTQGLGEAIAHLLAERGARGIVICGRNRDNGERVKAALAKKGAKAAYVEADLACVEDCRSVIAGAEKAFGQVDVL